MKDVKQQLKEAFSSIPNSFAYREVRFHVYQALQKAESLEKKEINRQKINKEQQIKEEEKRKSYYYPKETLNIIDQMIEKENKIIESIHSKKIKNTMPYKYNTEEETDTLNE